MSTNIDRIFKKNCGMQIIIRALVLISVLTAWQSALAQTDSVAIELDADTLITIAADTLSSDMQEGGLSVEALAAYNAGLKSYRLSQLDSAVAQFSRALELETHFPKALYNRGVALMKMESYRDAISD